MLNDVFSLGPRWPLSLVVGSVLCVFPDITLRVPWFMHLNEWVVSFKVRDVNSAALLLFSKLPFCLPKGFLSIFRGSKFSVTLFILSACWVPRSGASSTYLRLCYRLLLWQLKLISTGHCVIGAELWAFFVSTGTTPFGVDLEGLTRMTSHVEVKAVSGFWVIFQRGRPRSLVSSLEGNLKFLHIHTPG